MADVFLYHSPVDFQTGLWLSLELDAWLVQLATEPRAPVSHVTCLASYVSVENLNAGPHALNSTS